MVRQAYLPVSLASMFPMTGARNEIRLLVCRCVVLLLVCRPRLLRRHVQQVSVWLFLVTVPRASSTWWTLGRMTTGLVGPLGCPGLARVCTRRWLCVQVSVPRQVCLTRLSFRTLIVSCVAPTTTNTVVRFPPGLLTRQVLVLLKPTMYAVDVPTFTPRLTEL